MSEPVGRHWSSENTTRDLREYGGFVQTNQEELDESSGSDSESHSKSLGKKTRSFSLTTLKVSVARNSNPDSLITQSPDCFMQVRAREEMSTSD